MTSDSTQEEKQNFLRENNLENGYDANLFVEFLIGKKGEEGADVGNWTMNDLQKVVKEFISLQNDNKDKSNLNHIEKAQEINSTNFNKNKIKNSNNPLENNLSLNKGHVRYDPLSGGINKNEVENNQNLNQKNSSMKNFFVNNNANKNTNQILNNNSNQIQFLQQYLNLIKAQNPQFQNNLQMQYGLQNQQINQVNQQNNFQKNAMNFNSNNISKNNNSILTNPVNSTQQQNNSNTSQSQKFINPQPKISVENEKDKVKEEVPNKNIIQDNQSNIEKNQLDKNNFNKEGNDEKDTDMGIAYGIITNQTEETKFVDKTPLTTEENLLIQVGFPEKVEGGFFSKSYVTYLITTNSLNLKVKRRYSDFDWLR